MALSAFSTRTVESLGFFLGQKGFQEEIIDCLRGNSVDGATFLKFTREDLKDIFPTNFQFRKKIWDYLEDIRSQDYEILSDSPSPECAQPHVQSSASRMRQSPSSSDSERSSSPLLAMLREKQLESSQSSSTTSGTEPTIDIEEDYKFHVSAALTKCNMEGKYPEEKLLRHFIRDAAASLQAIVGEKITQSDFVLAAIKICQTLPVLKDPRPASFPSSHKYPYWSTVLFQLKRRVQNVKGYEKRQGKTKRSGLQNVQDGEFGEKELEELHALLLREVQSKKTNYTAVKEIQANTFDFRRKDIQQKTSDKSVVSDIVSSYPFLKIHECTLLNELELYCKLKDGDSLTVESWENNWKTISVKVKNCLQSRELIPDDQEFTPDEICGAFLEHATSIEKLCSLPILNVFPQIKASVDEIVRKETKTAQPTLWCALEDENMLDQAFIIVDKAVFLELSNISYLNTLLALISVLLST